MRESLANQAFAGLFCIIALKECKSQAIHDWKRGAFIEVCVRAINRKTSIRDFRISNIFIPEIKRMLFSRVQVHDRPPQL